MNYLQLYGMNGLSTVMPLPIKKNRAPSAKDTNAVPGQPWIDLSTGKVYQFGGTINGNAIWDSTFIRLVVNADTNSDVTFDANYNNFIVAIFNLNTGNGDEGTITINNSFVTPTSGAVIGATITGATASGFTTVKVTPAAGVLTVLYLNNGAAAFDGINVLYLTVTIAN